MKKLNKKKIKWIVKEVERREPGVWTIAHVQNITVQHAYRVAKKFKNLEPGFKKPGRKLKEIKTSAEIRLMILKSCMNLQKNMGLFI